MKRIMKLVFILTSLLLCSCSSETITPEKASCPIQIGVVMDVGGIDDGSYNEIVWNGVVQYADTYHLSSSCYKYFQSTNEEDYLPFLRNFAENVDVVIGASPLLNDAVLEASEEYHKVLFVNMLGEIEKSNVVNLTYDKQYIAYLSGAIAASKAMELEETSVGFIGDSLELSAAFEEGVQSVNEEITVEISMNEESDFTNTTIGYLEEGFVNEIKKLDYTISSSIIAEDFDVVLIKQVANDIFTILKNKTNNKLKAGFINSTSISILSVDSYDEVKRKVTIDIDSDDFMYQLVPSYEQQDSEESIEKGE